MFREIFGPKNDEAVNLEYYLTNTCFVGSYRKSGSSEGWIFRMLCFNQTVDTEQEKFHNTFLHFSRYSSVESSYWHIHMHCQLPVFTIHNDHFVAAVTEVNVVLQMTSQSNSVTKLWQHCVCKGMMYYTIKFMMVFKYHIFSNLISTRI